MWKLACTLLVFVLVPSVEGVLEQETIADASSRSPIDQDHTNWIDHVMRSISTIKPGMTRRELSRVFTEEGGLSTRTQKRYVYKQCPYIKVHVEFSPANPGANPDAATESPQDKIVKISRPYLEYSIGD